MGNTQAYLRSECLKDYIRVGTLEDFGSNAERNSSLVGLFFVDESWVQYSDFAEDVNPEIPVLYWSGETANTVKKRMDLDGQERIQRKAATNADPSLDYIGCSSGRSHSACRFDN